MQEANAEIERIRRYPASSEHARGFLAARRARLWRMPLWLWLPTIASLVGLFLLAVYAVAR